MELRTMTRAAAAALLWASTASAAGPAEPFVKRLTSVLGNTNDMDSAVESAQVAPQSPFPFSVRKWRLHGGKQEGVEVVKVDNGKLQFVVVPTRGMGIHWASVGDVRYGWDSPVKEVVHPNFVDLRSRGGLGWLEGFNEWICRCGLESSGHPGPDRFVDNTGAPAVMDLTSHGKIANLPAQEVEVVVDRVPPYRIRIRGKVHERMFYGPKLELYTEISTTPGSASLRVSDEVVNHGATEQEFQLLYHTNFGTPILEEGSVVEAAVQRLTPFNAHAAQGNKTWNVFAGPKAGFVEEVYCIRPLADEAGATTVLLRNKAADRGASLTWNTSQLPYLTVWKHTGAEADGYVAGIEPGTGFPNNRGVERKRGRVPKLPPGGKFQATIDFGLLTTAAEVQAASKQVAALQGKQAPTVDPQPEDRE